MQRGAELGQRFDLAALAHFIIAPLQVIEDQLLAGQFPRRDEFHILGSQPRRRLELVEGFVLPLFPLQLQPLGKGLRWLLSILFWRDCRRLPQGNLQDTARAAPWWAGRSQRRPILPSAE